jgi:hypothetical protein
MTEGNQTINGVKRFNTNIGVYNSAAIYPVSIERDTVQTQPWIALQSTLNNRYACGLGYDGATIMRFFVGEAAVNGSSLTTSHIRASLDWNGNMTIGNTSSTTSSGTLTVNGAITGNSTVTLNGLTASRAVVTNASKQLTSLEYTPNNTVSTIVSRDASGDFSAGEIRLETGIYLPDALGGSSLLDYYEVYDYSNNLLEYWTGPWAALQTGTLTCIRIGRLVTLYFPNVTATATVGAVISWNATLKPRHQPFADTYGPAAIVNASSTQTITGRIKVSAVGAITIGASSTGGNFTSSGTAGFAGFSISYLSA